MRPILRLLTLFLVIASSWCADGLGIVSLGPVGGGVGGANISGSIASTQVAVGTGSNQIGGSAALTFSGGVLASNAALTLQSTNVTVSTQQFDISGNFNGILGVLGANANAGTAAKTQFTAANDAGQQLYFGITSSAFTGNPNAAFIGASVPLVINATSLYLAGPATIDGVLTAGGASAPSANTFTGNLIWGGNTAAAYTPGAVGEVIEQQVTTPTNAASTGTYLALASITLSAGNWDINGTAVVGSNGATFVVGSAIQANIGTTSGASTGTVVGYNSSLSANIATGSLSQTIMVGTFRVQLTAPTIYYLNVLETYSAGTPQWRGSITARRAP